MTTRGTIPVSMPQFEVLAYIYIHGGITVAEFAEAFDLQLVSVEQRMAPLKAKGFIEPRNISADGRISTYFLTVAGFEIVREVRSRTEKDKT